jgi:hypothetical protein
MKIKEIVVSEREVEKEYQQLIENEKNIIEQERQKVRDEVYQQYNQDVNNAVTNIKNEIMKKWQHTVDSAYKKGEREGYNKGCEDTSIYVPCSFCNSDIFVQPGYDLHQFLIELANGAMVSHPECRRAYEQEQAEYYHQQGLDRLINRLEEKIRR